MLYAERIVQQAQQGAIPGDWHIFYGRPLAHWRVIQLALYGAARATMLSLLFLLIIAFALLFAGIPLSFLVGFLEQSTFISLNTMQLLMLLVGLLYLALCYWLIMRQSNWLRDGLFIVTPECVVEVTRLSQPQRRQVRVLDFAQVLTIQQDVAEHITLLQRLNLETLIAGFWQGRSSLSIQLLVQLQNYQVEQWLITRQFGPPELLVQKVLSAFAYYRARV